MGGTFVTKYQFLIEFTLPEFSDKKKITHMVHVDGRTKQEHASFDMIIGMDLMTELGLVIDLDNKSIRWKELKIELKPRGLLSNANVVQEMYAIDTAPDSIKNAEARQSEILDADYSATDIQEYVHSLNHLSQKEKDILKEMLQRHPTLSSGGLGTLKIKPIHIKLKEGAKPYHHRAYPIHKKVWKQPLRKK